MVKSNTERQQHFRDKRRYLEFIDLVCDGQDYIGWTDFVETINKMARELQSINPKDKDLKSQATDEASEKFKEFLFHPRAKKAGAAAYEVQYKICGDINSEATGAMFHAEHDMAGKLYDEWMENEMQGAGTEWYAPDLAKFLIQYFHLNKPGKG